MSKRHKQGQDNTSGMDAEKNSQKPGRAKAALQADTLEPRILLSATWVDADTGDDHQNEADHQDQDHNDVVAHMHGTGGDDDLLFGKRIGGSHFDDDGDVKFEKDYRADDDSRLDRHNTVDFSDSRSGVILDLTDSDEEKQERSLRESESSHATQGVVGSDYDDIFEFSKPEDGQTYKVDGGGGTNSIDLSNVDSNHVKFGDGTITIDDGDSSFTIEYQNIDSIEFADANALVVDGDLSGYEVTEETIIVDGDIALRVDFDGEGSAEIDYDVHEDRLHVTDVSDTGENSILTLDQMAGPDAEFDVTLLDAPLIINAETTIDHLTVESRLQHAVVVNGSVGDFEIQGHLGGKGSVDVNGDVASFTLTGNSDLSGSVTVSGDLGATTVGDDMSGSLKVGGDLESLTIGDKVDGKASITVAGDAGNISIGGGIDGSLLVGGDAALVTIDGAMSSATLDIHGSAEAISIGGNINDKSTIHIGAASSFSSGNVAGSVTIDSSVRGVTTGTISGSMEIHGDVSSLSLTSNADLSGTVTIAGNLGATSIGDDMTGSLHVKGDLDTLSIGDNVSSSAAINVAGSSGDISIADRMDGSLIVGGDAGTVAIGASVNNATVDIGGKAEAISIGGNINGKSTIHAGGAFSFSSGNLAGTVVIDSSVEEITTRTISGSLKIDGDVSKLSLEGNGDLKGTVKIAGDLGATTIGDNMTGSLIVGGDLKSLDVSDQFTSGASIEVTGSAGNIHIGNQMVRGTSIIVEGDLESVTVDKKINDGAFIRAGAVSGRMTISEGETVHNEDFSSPAEVIYDGTELKVKLQNSAPTDLDLSGAIVTENSAEGTIVGTAAAVDPDKDETFSYALTDNAGGRFEIDAETGEVRVAKGADLDFESQASHDVTVQVTDSAGNTYEEAFSIAVTDIPTVTITGNTVLSVSDGPFDDLVINASTVTIDGTLEVNGDLTIKSLYRLMDGEIHVGGDVTTLDNSFGGSGTVVLDGSGDQTISAGGGTGEISRLSIEKTSGTVTLIDEIEISGSYEDNGSVVDATGARVELQGNPNIAASGTTFGDLELNASTVTIDGTLDVDGDLTITSLYRLQSGGIHVAGDITTLDASIGGSGTFVLDGTGDQTISAGGGVGELNHLSIEKPSGTVTLIDEIEISGSYKDNGTNVDATGAKVELQGNPNIAASGTTFGDLELNASTVTIDGTLDVDGDLTITSLYRLQSGGIHVAGDITTLDASIGGSGTFVLDGTGDQTISAGGGVGELNHLSIEKPSGTVTLIDEIEISGSYKDNGTNVDATGAKVELQGNPTISANSTMFGDVELNASTVKIDGDMWVHGDIDVTQLYRLEGGVIHVAGSINMIDSSWGGSGQIVPWNQAPTDLDFKGGSIAEDAKPGTVVGAAYATDPDRDDKLTYELTDNADGRFEIDAETGVVSVARGADLDFENAGTHEISIKVTDSAGHERMESFEIQVTDVNEAITDLDFKGGSIPENAKPGTVVGAAYATDPDRDDKLTYELTDNADGRFEIDAETGVVSVARGADLDFENAGTHEISIKVTDSAGHERMESFEIQVTDVNEAITDLDFKGGSIPENAKPGTVVGAAYATDPDRDDKLTYELTDNADGRFEIDAETGVVSVARGADLDFENAGTHEISIKVTDSAGHERMESFEIQVTDVNEAITDLDFKGGSIPENAKPGTVVGAAYATDPDRDDKLTYELTDNADGRFEIDAETGVVSVARGADLDFENAESHTIQITVTDSAGNTREISHVIELEDQADTPQPEDVGREVNELHTADSDDESRSSEERINSKLDRTEELTADELLYRPGLSADGFVPVAVGLNEYIPQDIDWKSTDFGEVSVLNNLEEQAPETIDPQGALSEYDTSPADVEEVATLVAAGNETGLLAKLWGFARAYRGVSESGSSNRQERS
ncbi:cadherin domain-containing protein [Bythopirellula goksoeyrii]|uniref:Cadherin domain protein n=1 Tax=Bythopirellula goksoeyrii TaxID=1400387 RepID=A0A5B9QBC0_9BACT|nr:cadherin domain-containing protein [Bythopirellula goksoeyrii]QEG36337.1 Cadherin domain protein [Bythopirellula goksoeyrii]